VPGLRNQNTATPYKLLAHVLPEPTTVLHWLKCAVLADIALAPHTRTVWGRCVAGFYHGSGKAGHNKPWSTTLLPMANDQSDVIRVLEQTARSLKEQGSILWKQSHDLRKEAARLRAASKKARAARYKKT